jgi:hypothetical protein
MAQPKKYHHNIKNGVVDSGSFVVKVESVGTLIIYL